MLIVSQNLLRYTINFPPDTILRVNLAWVSNLNILEEFVLDSNHDIFLDIPTNRIKPPSNNYSIDELKPIVLKYKKIKYLAVSNVEGPEIIDEYQNIFGSSVSVVPKIETVDAIYNIDTICSSLQGAEKILMLDHDDLFSNIVSRSDTVSEFSRLIEILVKYCEDKGIILLRARGIIFSSKI